MTFLQIASLLIVLAGVFGTINYLFLKLPAAIGILVVSLLASFGIMALDLAIPSLGLAETVREQVTGVDFSEALLEGMLGLLLFAGALHVKLSDLRDQWRLVFLMATLGVGLSTVIAGLGFHWMTGMPILIALVFGALISPHRSGGGAGGAARGEPAQVAGNQDRGRIAFQRRRGLRRVSGARRAGLSLEAIITAAGFEGAAPWLFVQEALGRRGAGRAFWAGSRSGSCGGSTIIRLRCC